MKCAACGYEKRTVKFKTTEVITYKSGKRKGELKEVKETFIEPDKDKLDFIPIYIKEGAIDFSILKEGWGRRDFYEIQLWACPECSTIRMTC